MKLRKNLYLDASAVAKGTRAARRRGVSLSTLVERHLESLETGRAAPPGDFWPGRLEPLARPGEARAAYLARRHA
jgi:hypothetical protein